MAVAAVSSSFTGLSKAFRDRIVNVIRFDEHVASLTRSQRQFVAALDDWFLRPRNLLLLVSGGPGSGKTHTIVETLRHVRVPNLRMAYTAKIAQKIDGHTIHSTMCLRWGEGTVLAGLEARLRDSDDVEECLVASAALREELGCRNVCVRVVVIDEIGMVPFWLAYRVIEHFFDRGVAILVVCMGDSRQLRPVKSQHNLFGVSLDDKFETCRLEMMESKRFTHTYRPVIEELRQLLDSGRIEDLVRYVEETFPVVPHVDADVLAGCTRALAYRKATVDTFNRHYLSSIPGRSLRLVRIVDGAVDHAAESVLVKAGCMVMVTENGCGHASNGTHLTFECYDAERDVAVCRDDRNAVVLVERSVYTNVIPLVLGFACTVHKFQGETLDERGIVFCFDGCRDMNLIYTALSRVRDLDQIRAVTL